MDLNLFKNIKKETESNISVQGFIKELSDFLNSIVTQKNISDKIKRNIKAPSSNEQTIINEEIQQYRKEDHLYLVTEDRDNEVYLMDFTEKSKHEFKETSLSKELLDVAKEGAMLQYKNGEYTLYSKHGYDILFNEENNINNTIK